MTRRSFASIRARLAMLVVLAVLPAFALLVYQAWEEHKQEADAALEKALLVTRLVSSQQDHLVAGARQLLVVLAQLPQVRQEDAATCSLLLAEMLNRYKQYTNLGATAPDGEVFCSAIASRGAERLSDRPWFQQVMQSRDFAMGEYQIGRLTGKPSLVFALPAFEPAGEIRAVVYAALDLAWLNRVVASAHLPADAAITVIDRTGIVLARHPDSEKWVGKAAPEAAIGQAIRSGREGTARTVGTDGVDRLVAFAPLGREGAGGASVSMTIPAEHVFGRVRHVLMHHLVGLLLAATVTLALAWTGSTLFLIRPVQVLAATTRRLQRGELAARTGLPGGPGELGELARVFDEMAEALEDRVRARDRAVQALQESERRYRELTDALPQTVFECDLEGRLLFANRTAFEMFGYTPEELARGLSAFQMLAPEDRSRAAETIRRLAQESGIIGDECTAVRRDGSRFPAMIYGTRIEQEGSAIGLRGILVDITEREKMEDALRARTRQLEAVRDVTAEIVQELDLTRLLQLIVQRACELTGGAAADIDLWDPRQELLVPEVSYGHTTPRPVTPRRPGEGVMGTVAQTRQGLIINNYRSSPLAHPETRAHTRITASLVEPLLYRETLLGAIGVDHETPGQTFTAQDQAMLQLFASQAAIAIENARLYEELRLAAAQLEARVQERTQELAEANRQLEAASHHKSEFLANMSHELRTPLNSILGFSQFLLEQSTEALSAKQRRFLAHIHTSGEHLLQLINDILDFSKVEAGKLGLHLEPLAVSRVLEETLVMIRALAQGKEIRLTTELDSNLPRVVADPLRIKQILFNLLGNAVKFTPERGHINVRLGRVSGPGREGDEGAARDWLELRVADTGIGIEAEDIPRLFQDFVQLEAAATKRHGGTGLGLALTRRLVELHGGRIWAESDGSGRGACFVVQIPIVETPAPRILVVDDDLPLLQLLCMILREGGYAVVSARDVSEAIAALTAAAPALVVLDVGLPPDNGGGWRVLEHIRTSANLQTTPVLILTGQDQIRPEEALARGANEFLGKPVSPQVLIDTVARLLRQSTPASALSDPRVDVGR